MATSTPYIGSKISLISKAEIRYEGVLYDVDSKEATVTLSKVKSFGTENRQVPKHIPPRSETYEYIIFRGSDIKDLTVSEMGNRTEDPVDPAILSAQATPPISRQDPIPTSLNSRGPTSILPAPPIPPGVSSYSQFPPGMGAYNPFGMPPYFARPPLMMGPPTHPIGPPTNQQPHPSTPPNHISTITSNNTRVPISTAINPNTTVQEHTEMPTFTTSQSSISTPVASQGSVLGTPSVSVIKSSATQPKQTQMKSAVKETHRDITSGSAVVANKEMNGSPEHNVGKKSSSNSPNDDSKQPKRVTRGRNYTRGQRTPNVRRGSGNWQPRQRGGPYTPTHNQPLKYTKEFDFESANALFSKDQLAREMKKKLKITDDAREGGSDGAEVTVTEEDELEDGELDERDDGGCEKMAYNKSESFFDNLTTDNQSENRRMNRGQEMALNTETFGVTNRGYSGRPRGGGNSGRGYNSRYRGWNNYYSNNRSNNYTRGRGGYRRQGRGNYGRNWRGNDQRNSMDNS